MIVGRVVARFGAGGEVTATTLSAGGILLAVGAAGVVYGTVRYRAVSRELEPGEYVTGGQSTGQTLAAVILVLALLAALGLLLAEGFRLSRSRKQLASPGHHLLRTAICRR